MRILIFGSDARAHVIADRLQREGNTLFCLRTGNIGLNSVCKAWDIGQEDYQEALARAREEKIDWIFVSPEKPLVDGVIDLFAEAGIPGYGHSRQAAQFEGSKAFCKRVLTSAQIPTPKYVDFTDSRAAKDYVRRHGGPLVVKADGLAAGKGVTVCTDIATAEEAVDDILERNIFKHAQPRVVIEERLVGRESSYIIVTDGTYWKEMVSVRDYKHAYDGNQGPMTGGMGAYAPDPAIDDEKKRRVRARILLPFLAEANRLRIPIQGTVYFGLMWVGDDPYVLEINMRFGDPETQVTIPLLKSSLTELLWSVIQRKLSKYRSEWEEFKAVGVVLASGGYPGSYETGKEISGLSGNGSTRLYHAGTTLENQVPVTSGGRVVTVVGFGDTFRLAKRVAYRRLEGVYFDGACHRTDIADEVIDLA